MYVVRVRLTKQYKHGKNENKIEFEEDFASDFIREGRLRSTHKVEEIVCRFLSHRVCHSH